MAIFVVLFSAFLIFHQRHDFMYALTSSSPQVLGAVGDLMKPGAAPLPENRYVRINGTPDFESALILDTQGEWKFRSFFRLLQADRKLFVQRASGPLPLDMVQNNSFAGRLVRLKSVGFSESIRAYFAAHVASTRVFDAAVLRRAMEEKRLPGVLADKLGESVPIAGNEPLSLDVRVPFRYNVDIPREIYETVEAATKALAKTGAVVIGAGRSVVREANLSGFAFECEFPADRELQVLSAVADLASRARVLPKMDNLVAPLSQLQSTPTGLQVTKPGAEIKSIDWNHVQAVRTTTNLEIPDDAYLLLEGERPSSHYKSVVATAFLFAFGLINLLALRRRS